MSDDIEQQFRALANAFIDLANQKCDEAPRENVGMALLYAASRFNAFVVAAHAADLRDYEGAREKAMEFFRGEYERMLGENLDDYRQSFDEDFKYAHLMKRD